MRSTDQFDPSDPQDGAPLWRQAKQAFAASRPDPAAGVGLDELSLAAYLDGRLDATARDRVEGLLAADPLALEGFLAADAAVGATQQPPASLLARAQRLVPDAAENRFGFIGRLFGGRDRSGGFRLRPMVLAGSLVAILVVSVAGFELGRFGYAVAEETYFPQTDSLAQAANSAF